MCRIIVKVKFHITDDLVGFSGWSWFTYTSMADNTSITQRKSVLAHCSKQCFVIMPRYIMTVSNGFGTLSVFLKWLECRSWFRFSSRWLKRRKGKRWSSCWHWWCDGCTCYWNWVRKTKLSVICMYFILKYCLLLFRILIHIAFWVCLLEIYQPTLGWGVLCLSEAYKIEGFGDGVSMLNKRLFTNY